MDLLETDEHMDNPNLLEEVKQITMLMAQRIGASSPPCEID